MSKNSAPSLGFFDTMAYKETYDFLTLISPTNQDVLTSLVSGNKHQLEELYTPTQLSKFDRYITEYEEFIDGLDQEVLDELIVPTDQLKFEAIRLILRYTTTNTPANEKELIPQSLMSLYEEIFGTISKDWIAQQIADRRARRAISVLSNTSTDSRWSSLLLQEDVINDDEYSQLDLDTFANIFGLTSKPTTSQPLNYIYSALYNWLLSYLQAKYPGEEPSDITSEQMQSVGSSVLELLYASILPNLGINIPHKSRYEVVIDPTRKTMVKSEEMKQVILPNITRPFSRLCTLVFHEIGTHLLKSTLLELYSDEPKIDGYLDVEEGYCTLVDAYYMDKIRAHYDSIYSREHVFGGVRPDNAIYSFAIALKLSGYTIQDVITAIRVWWQTNSPELTQKEVETKTETATRRIFRGCLGTDMVFIKDKAYTQGFRAWKKCFELYQSGNEDIQDLIHTICNPPTWIAGGYNPFDLSHIDEQNSRQPLFGSIKLTSNQRSLHQQLFGNKEK
jgi:hypothetical protein